MCLSAKCRQKNRKGVTGVPDNNLRGRIVSMYHSIRKFAEVIHWSTRKAYDIVNGKQDMTGRDIEDMCRVLDVKIPDDMRLLFFK